MILPEFARDLGQKIDYFFEVEVILEVNIDILEKKLWNQGKIQKFQNHSKTNHSVPEHTLGEKKLTGLVTVIPIIYMVSGSKKCKKTKFPTEGKGF